MTEQPTPRTEAVSEAERLLLQWNCSGPEDVFLAELRAYAAQARTEALDVLRRVASMGSCSQTHHEHIAKDARAILDQPTPQALRDAVLARHDWLRDRHGESCDCELCLQMHIFADIALREAQARTEALDVEARAGIRKAIDYIESGGDLAREAALSTLRAILAAKETP